MFYAQYIHVNLQVVSYKWITKAPLRHTPSTTESLQQEKDFLNSYIICLMFMFMKGSVFKWFKLLIGSDGSGILAVVGFTWSKGSHFSRVQLVQECNLFKVSMGFKCS